MNHLEQLAAEWYEYKGFFVRRNVRVGLRLKGGHEGELDVVTFEPTACKLIHIETSMDADSWGERERRFKHKFDTGEKYIRSLFHGISSDTPIEKVAIFGIGSRTHHPTIGGGKVLIVNEFIVEILSQLKSVSWLRRAVPEQFPLVRTLQLVAHFRSSICNTLSEK